MYSSLILMKEPLMSPSCPFYSRRTFTLGEHSPSENIYPWRIFTLGELLLPENIYFRRTFTLGERLLSGNIYLCSWNTKGQKVEKPWSKDHKSYISHFKTIQSFYYFFSCVFSPKANYVILFTNCNIIAISVFTINLFCQTMFWLNFSIPLDCVMPECAQSAWQSKDWIPHFRRTV